MGIVNPGKVLFTVVGALFMTLFAIEWNPVFFEFVHNFIAPTDESLLFRTVLVWSSGALILAIIYVFFKGDWKQLLLVIVVYFLAYYIDGFLWFRQEQQLYELGLYVYDKSFIDEFHVSHFSNFMEYDICHVTGSNLHYLFYKSLCFSILFAIPFFIGRLIGRSRRKSVTEVEVIDD